MRTFFLLARLVALAATTWAFIAPADCTFLHGTCRATDLLSYFTIESNLAFIGLLVLLVIRDLRKLVEPEWLTALRALVTTYLIVAGVTFAALIANAGLMDVPFLDPFSSKVQHFVVPVFALLDFLLAPGRVRLHWRTGLVALVFPALYAVYTLLRGNAVGWYPYVFLDPRWTGSYTAVALYLIALTVLILVLSYAMVLLARLPATGDSRRIVVPDRYTLPPDARLELPPVQKLS